MASAQQDPLSKKEHSTNSSGTSLARLISEAPLATEFGSPRSDIKRTAQRTPRSAQVGSRKRKLDVTKKENYSSPNAAFRTHAKAASGSLSTTMHATTDDAATCEVFSYKARASFMNWLGTEQTDADKETSLDDTQATHVVTKRKLGKRSESFDTVRHKLGLRFFSQEL
jgi:hypothetical protein